MSTRDGRTSRERIVYDNLTCSHNVAVGFTELLRSAYTRLSNNHDNNNIVTIYQAISRFGFLLDIIVPNRNGLQWTQGHKENESGTSSLVKIQ